VQSIFQPICVLFAVFLFLFTASPVWAAVEPGYVGLIDDRGFTTGGLTCLVEESGGSGGKGVGVIEAFLYTSTNGNGIADVLGSMKLTQPDGKVSVIPVVSHINPINRADKTAVNQLLLATPVSLYGAPFNVRYRLWTLFALRQIPVGTILSFEKGKVLPFSSYAAQQGSLSLGTYANIKDIFFSTPPEVRCLGSISQKEGYETAKNEYNQDMSKARTVLGGKSMNYLKPVLAFVKGWVSAVGNFYNGLMDPTTWVLLVAGFWSLVQTLLHLS
jgi:hypothetical protein